MNLHAKKAAADKAPTTPMALVRRIEAWQQRLAHLGIGHFRIVAVHLTDETPGGRYAKAAVQASTDYDTCEFWFALEHLEGCTERDLDETIIHEWLHVAWRDFDGVVDSVEPWMPKATYADFDDRIHHECEGLIERLARSIAAFYYGSSF